MFCKLNNYLYRSVLIKLSRSNTMHYRSYKELIDVHPNVKTAIKSFQPIVALESTIITHGMPYPQNFDTAVAVEKLIKSEGAVPATIAILEGRIKVGLTKDDLLELTNKQSNVVKCSRRDIPYAISKKINGGTTVSATIAIANMVGIKIFATGGIGGVHANGHITMDISNDLIELAKTPIAVVCSGVKSILDISRTLEYLETHGICVASYESEDNTFPNFYRQNSGYKAPYNLNGPREAALVIHNLNMLNQQPGILIAAAIPQQYEIDEFLLKNALSEAYREAELAGIVGKEITPFLLAAITRITKGKSLLANVSLIKHNAIVASKISKELMNIQKINNNYNRNIKPNVEEKPLIIGATMLDICLTKMDDTPVNFDGATLPSSLSQSVGGVGYNIAEGICKLFGKVNFISAIGDDNVGKNLLHCIPQTLRNGILLCDNKATATCVIFIDSIGECLFCAANTDILESISSEVIAQHEDHFKKALIIIIDANLNTDCMQMVLQLATKYNQMVFLEPTDKLKVGKLFHISRDLTKQIRIISPNIHELKAITETVTGRVQTHIDITADTPINALFNECKKCLCQIESFFDLIVVTLGYHGVLVSLRGKDYSKPLFRDGKYIYVADKGAIHGQPHSMRFYPALPVSRVVNVSGAGDSFASGLIAGLLRGLNTNQSISLGLFAATKALQAQSAVPSTYYDSLSELDHILDPKNINYYDF